jgi:hypothetical protein
MKEKKANLTEEVTANEQTAEQDIKVQYGVAVLLTEDKDVVVKFLEGSQKEVRLQEALGLLEIAKFQIIGSVKPNKDGVA